jgi:hypothetical protein
MLEPFAGNQSSLCGVVHMWCLDAKGSLSSAESGLNAALEISCRSALYLTQALVRGGGRSAPRCSPAQAQLASRLASPSSVGVARQAAASSLWGLQSHFAGHPELRCSLLDLDASSDEGDRIGYWTRLSSVKRGGSIAWAGYRHLAPQAAARNPPQAAVVRPDRTYLITGGRGR